MSNLDDEIRELFLQAIEMPDSDRQQFLSGLSDLQREEVSKLLAENQQIPNFLRDIVNDPKLASTTITNRLDESSRRIGPYKILQKIGQGGMGQVFMAEQTQPVKRRVALKIIKTETPTKEGLRCDTAAIGYWKDELIANEPTGVTDVLENTNHHRCRRIAPDSVPLPQLL